jgi:hypothetical protein
VIQNCLGDKASTLSERFCGVVSTTLGSRLQSPVRPDAWWATDYHLDWLAGALVWDAETGLNDRERPRRNQEQLIRGNQEDIDLIIASGSDVILLEAKGHFSFVNGPLANKVGRLSVLCNSETGIVPTGESAHSIKLRLIFLSINKPVRVKYEQWPAWAGKDDGPYWMCLEASGDLMRVGRCDSEGDEGAEGGHWHMWREPASTLS